LYQRLLKEYPQESQEDHVYYQLASAMDQMGEIEKGIKVLHALAEGSGVFLYAGGMFSSPERLFDKNQLNRAADILYTRVLV